MENQYTTTETQIPVIIYTGYMHDAGNRFEEARQQIEKSAFYLQSIFNLLRRAAAQLAESNEFGGI